MDESVNIKNEKQARQKPPRNLIRIAGEILAGAATSAALVYSSFFLVGYGAKSAGWGGSQMDGLAVLGILGMVVPLVHVVGCTIGVYVIGRLGNQTGSLLATLGGCLLGLPVMGLLYFYIGAAEDMMIGIEKVVLWPLVFLVAPCMATLGFNLTRRYKDRKNING